MRDPNNFGKQWRTVREELKLPEGNHAQLPQDGRHTDRRRGVVGPDWRADHLGHSKVSMTQDRYMTRVRVHTQVADLPDRTVRINDE